MYSKPVYKVCTIIKKEGETPIWKHGRDKTATRSPQNHQFFRMSMQVKKKQRMGLSHSHAKFEILYKRLQSHPSDQLGHL